MPEPQGRNEGIRVVDEFACDAQRDALLLGLPTPSEQRSHPVRPTMRVAAEIIVVIDDPESPPNARRGV